MLYGSLQEMNCNYNEITKAGAVSLVENAALLPALKTLHLDGNNLGEAGMTDGYDNHFLKHILVMIYMNGIMSVVCI